MRHDRIGFKRINRRKNDQPHIMEDSEESQIQKMFSGSTIFLTGGTGFLGKLLIEKLLRSCPKIKKLYVLIRQKKNKDTKKRLQEQFDDVLYDKLRNKMPDFLQKIDILEGDMGQVNMGMSDADRSKLTNEVDFIFHGAATVRFDETLKTAVEINVRGTREMLQLAHECSKLRAFVHISTAYWYIFCIKACIFVSNCHLNEIDEKFYGINLSGDMLIDLVENIDENILKNITPGLLDNLPNTYTYSKLAAEDIIQKHSQGLPVAIFRPSIVISTACEPLPGWIDNMYGPTGVIAGVGVGLIHVLNYNLQVKTDLVPGDYVVNGVIAAAWKTAKDYPANDEHSDLANSPLIYNYVSSEQNPLIMGTFINYAVAYGAQVPTMQAIWMNIFWITSSKFLFNLYFLLLHSIPALIVDTIAILIGKKPLLRPAYKKIRKYLEVISYFTLREWKFHNKNTVSLLKELDDADKHTFNFDIESLKWEEYCKDYLLGMRLYLVKDPLETLPQARKKQLKLKLAHYFLVSVIALGLLAFMWILVRLFI
ncbi:unnamed protein product, partial [Brenthis ino]